MRLRLIATALHFALWLLKKEIHRMTELQAVADRIKGLADLVAAAIAAGVSPAALAPITAELSAAADKIQAALPAPPAA